MTLFYFNLTIKFSPFANALFYGNSSLFAYHLVNLIFCAITRPLQGSWTGDMFIVPSIKMETKARTETSMTHNRGIGTARGSLEIC